MMIITSWNVNGLRAVLRKGNFAWLEDQAPDVLCLQEIKSRPEQIGDELPRFMREAKVLWNPAEKAGYSGVATWGRIPIERHLIGLGIPEFDSEGRVIGTYQNGFWLLNVYFPSGQRGQGRVEFKLAFYAAVLELIGRLRGEGADVAVCGDFNTAHREIDLRNPKSNHKTSGFLPEERAWVDRYLESGLVDVFRRQYPERVQYTWWTYLASARERNVGWRLDYFLVSEGLLPRVQDALIHDDRGGSDHCPVSLVLADAA